MGLENPRSRAPLTFREAFGRQLAYQVHRQVIGHMIAVGARMLLEELLRRRERAELLRVIRAFGGAR